MHSPVSRRLAILGLLVVLLPGCQSMQDMLSSAPRPKARIIGSSIRGLSLENIVLLFDVEVENPYDAGLPLADLGYTLSSGGKPFLAGSLKPTGSIPAHGRQVLQVPATVQFAALAAALKGVRPGSVVPYTADFRLGMDAPVAGRLDVPLSKSGELPVPAVPQVELGALKVEKLGVEQIRATAKLRVRNTNQFPLDLTKLGVGFALAGQDVGSTRLANPVGLPAGGTAAVDVPLAISPKGAALGLVNLLRGNQIAYKVSGSLDANSRFGPISLPFSHIGNAAVTR
ncbi:MAG TPA: LEA type 2 family protein [Burkholderiales bacterium]|nr:LEA type 2 family protein [Burkholderiales bacterium]